MNAKIKALSDEGQRVARDTSLSKGERNRRLGGLLAQEIIARGMATLAPGFDPTCIFCTTGDEPGHEH